MPSPTGFSPVTRQDFSYLGFNNIRALLGGSKWGGVIGSGFSLTYSFPWSVNESASWDLGINGYTQNDPTNLNSSNEPYRAATDSLNIIQQDFVSSALSKWANVANIQFTLVDDNAVQVGDLRFTFTTAVDEGGHAYFPNQSAIAGDIWLPVDQSDTTFANPKEGTYGYHTFLHEIGHSLGLKHPFEGYSLPTDQDWYANSVMSYNDWKRSEDPNRLVTADFSPTTPMWYDIAAIQFLYGANNSYHTGNDVYTYRENEHYWETIWDAGGNDTINYIGSAPAKIDLRDGYFSDMGLDVEFSNNMFLFGTITIFHGVIIENAYGGSGDDTLHGNSVNNFLNGYLGTDTAVFDNYKSEYKVSKIGTNYTVSSVAEGTDTLVNIELLQFKDGTFPIDSVLQNHAPTGSVLITGNPTQGQVLTASNSLADLDGLGVISYQWLNNGIAINNANQATYSLTQADVRKNISVSASYIDGFGKRESVDSSVVTIANVNDLPTGSVLITGNPTQGQVLTASNSLADLDGLGVISYQWLNVGVEIKGAIQSTYTLTATDAGKNVSVKASYTDLQGTDESATSHPIEPISGSNGNDSITGTDNDDTLDGSLGKDTLVGGQGDDSYIIDNKGDKIIEELDAGTDTVQSLITYILGNNLENLELLGVSKISGTGNKLDNLLLGNDGHNILKGMAGNDTLIGGKGSDTLTGGKGIDTFSFSTSDFLTENESGDFVFNKSVDTISDFNLKDGDLLSFVDSILEFYPDLVSAKSAESELFYVKGTIYFNVDTTALNYTPVAIIKLTGNPKVNADFIDFAYPSVL